MGILNRCYAISFAYAHNDLALVISHTVAKKFFINFPAGVLSLPCPVLISRYLKGRFNHENFTYFYYVINLQPLFRL